VSVNFTIHDEQTFPVGTAVDAYAWSAGTPPPVSGRPPGSVSANATVASDGTLTFNVLGGRTYLLYAAASGRMKTVTVAIGGSGRPKSRLTPADPADGQSPVWSSDYNDWVPEGRPVGAGTVFSATSASTMQLFNSGTASRYAALVLVAGSATVNAITPAAPGNAGQVIVLKCAAGPTFKDGTGNLKLAGDFVATADDTLTLVCDGSFWVEMARSVN